MAHGIHLSYHLLYQLGAASLIEHWNRLLKVQMKHQLRGNTLQGWRAIPQVMVYTWNQRPLSGACVLSRKQDPGTKEWKQVGVPSYISSNDLHQGILSFPAPQFWALQS